MLQHAREMGAAALDLLFPPLCQVCGAYGAAFCPRCQAQALAAAPPPGLDGLDGCEAVGIHEGPLREAVLRLKFGGRLSLVEPLGLLMAEHVRPRLPEWSPAALVPVPVHWRRRVARGFNQSDLLAAAVGRALGLPVLSRALVRTGHRHPQVGLAAAERRDNLRGAFRVAQPVPPGSRLLLVDDVRTTGATLLECAATLRAAGAGAVYGLTLSAELM
jgi:ComF family protein